MLDLKAFPIVLDGWVLVAYAAAERESGKWYLQTMSNVLAYVTRLTLDGLVQIMYCLCTSIPWQHPDIGRVDPGLEQSRVLLPTPGKSHAKAVQVHWDAHVFTWRNLYIQYLLLALRSTYMQEQNHVPRRSLRKASFLPSWPGRCGAGLDQEGTLPSSQCKGYCLFLFPLTMATTDKGKAISRGQECWPKTGFKQPRNLVSIINQGRGQEGLLASALCRSINKVPCNRYSNWYMPSKPRW